MQGGAAVRRQLTENVIISGQQIAGNPSSTLRPERGGSWGDKVGIILRQLLPVGCRWGLGRGGSPQPASNATTLPPLFHQPCAHHRMGKLRSGWIPGEGKGWGVCGPGFLASLTLSNSKISGAGLPDRRGSLGRQRERKVCGEQLEEALFLRWSVYPVPVSKSRRNAGIALRTGRAQRER